MLLLSWNVRFQSLPGKIDNVIEAIRSASPDIVTLQEVKTSLADDVAGRLADIGLVHAYFSGKNAPPTAMRERPPIRRLKRKDYQCLIASRWPVTAADNRWRRRAPYPEMLARAKVSVPGEQDIDLFTVHIPNGSGNGWRKIDTFNVLSATLRRQKDAPRVLTGDFNEPKRFRQSGQIVPFGEKIHEKGGTSIRGCHTKFGDRRPNMERVNGVRSVLAGASQHGLRDAYRDLHGFEIATPVTHCTTRGNPRCFDHTFVSRHFKVVECGYFHDWRKQGWSDHSAMWTKLIFREKIPELIEWEMECSVGATPTPPGSGRRGRG